MLLGGCITSRMWSSPSETTYIEVPGNMVSAEWLSGLKSRKVKYYKSFVDDKYYVEDTRSSRNEFSEMEISLRILATPVTVVLDAAVITVSVMLHGASYVPR